MNIFETSLAPQGQRATETAHRKIELQSPADLTYLIANVSRAAREKLDKHLPPDAAPEGEDAMRKRVEQLVDEVGFLDIYIFALWRAGVALIAICAGGSTFGIRSAWRRIV